MTTLTPRHTLIPVDGKLERSCRPNDDIIVNIIFIISKQIICYGIKKFIRYARLQTTEVGKLFSARPPFKHSHFK